MIDSNWHLLKYILFAENPNNLNEIFCVNLLSNTWFILTREEFILLFDLEKLKSKENIFKNFVQQGIIINFDEKKYLDILTKNLSPFDGILNLTICPTMACNFNCPYCFENHYSSRMTEETQNDIFNFIKRINDKKKIKKIGITWYGGEPLLGIDIIESLSLKIIHFTDENKINYKASIITNGFLLDQKKADILEQAKVYNYQITLDGVGENHNLTRHLIDNKPTFEKIINNLKNTKIKGQISIRQNIHENNKQDIVKLKQLIIEISKQSNNNIIYYSSPVTGSNVGDKRKDQVCLLNEKDTSQIEIEKDIPRIKNSGGSYCGAQCLNSIVIDDKGNLYKCWEDVDKLERSFGNIKKWDFFNPYYTSKKMNILLHYFNSIGGIDDLECQECIWLPVCKGGCPNKRIFYKKKCVGYKNYPEDYVLKFVKKYPNKNKKFS